MGYNSGTKTVANSVYATDAFLIGTCKAGDAWLSCSGGHNDYGIRKANHGDCSAGQYVKITIACVGSSTKMSSCTGIREFALNLSVHYYIHY